MVLKNELLTLMLHKFLYIYRTHTATFHRKFFRTYHTLLLCILDSVFKEIINIIEISKEFVRIILPKYYTFINDTSFECIYTHSLL